MGPELGVPVGNPIGGPGARLGRRGELDPHPEQPDGAQLVEALEEGDRGVCNEAGNVVGLMPHPEHAVDPLLGSTDGLVQLHVTADNRDGVLAGLRLDPLQRVDRTVRVRVECFRSAAGCER